MKCPARDMDKPNQKCGEEAPLGFKYCEKHANRKKGVEERVRAGVGSLGQPQNTNMIIDLDEVDEPEDWNTDPKFDPGMVRTPDQTKEIVPITNTTSHKTIVDQINDGLKRVTDFEFAAWEQAMKIPIEQWRYRDHKSGSEQVHGIIQILERAMDRTQRYITTVTKLGLDAKAQIIEKAQYEGVRAALNRTFVRLGFDKKQIDEALRIFAEEIQKLVTPTED